MRTLTAADTNWLAELKNRSVLEDPKVRQVVQDIIADVRARGDEALLEYTAKLDKCTLTADEIIVTEAEKAEALESVGPELRRILQLCADNVRRFHEHQVEQGFSIPAFGGTIGQRILSIPAVGVYAPGGTAAYPSSVIMNLIPALVAGCGHIAMATPPGPDGKLPAVTLAAAAIAGATVIYKMGGAQAIAALAYGTKTVRAVDKITGPGNAFVATAKREVFGQVGIDSFAGPSDVTIVCDATANPAYVAADLLAQAEHDTRASAIAITLDAAQAQAISAEVDRQLALLPRAAIATQSLEAHGAILVTNSLEKAMELVNAIAPEHLELCVADPEALLPLVRNAGAIFLGHSTPEALGDYLAGPNHTLPTDGAARYASPLSVRDFVKIQSVLHASPQGLAAIASDIAAFASKEGLDAHARSVTIRLED